MEKDQVTTEQDNITQLLKNASAINFAELVGHRIAASVIYDKEESFDNLTGKQVRILVRHAVHAVLTEGEFVYWESIKKE